MNLPDKQPFVIFGYVLLIGQILLYAFAVAFWAFICWWDIGLGSILPVAFLVFVVRPLIYLVAILGLITAAFVLIRYKAFAVGVALLITSVVPGTLLYTWDMDADEEMTQVVHKMNKKSQRADSLASDLSAFYSVPRRVADFEIDPDGGVLIFDDNHRVLIKQESYHRYKFASFARDFLVGEEVKVEPPTAEFIASFLGDRVLNRQPGLIPLFAIVYYHGQRIDFGNFLYI